MLEPYLGRWDPRDVDIDVSLQDRGGNELRITLRTWLFPAFAAGGRRQEPSRWPRTCRCSRCSPRAVHSWARFWA